MLLARNTRCIAMQAANRRSWLQSWTCIYCHYVNCTHIVIPDLWMVQHRLLRRINTVIVCNHSSHVHTFCTTSPVIGKRQSDYVSTSNRCDRWAGYPNQETVAVVHENFVTGRATALIK